jgi:uncharacterized SAM-binding protein YcdF (DUF218 family)
VQVIDERRSTRSTGTVAATADPAGEAPEPGESTDGPGVLRRIVRGAKGIARHRRTRRALRVAAPIGLAMAIIFTVLSWRWFWYPPTDEPRPVDAVVVLGGAGPRLATARELVADDLAPNFVIVQNNSRSVGNYIPECFDGGDELAGADVTCFDPIPGTTRGEAREIARMANDNGWTSMMVVVSTDQVHRARQLIERCVDGVELVMVDVPTWENRVFRTAYEWGALTKATFVHPGC